MEKCLSQLCRIAVLLLATNCICAVGFCSDDAGQGPPERSLELIKLVYPDEPYPVKLNPKWLDDLFYSVGDQGYLSAGSSSIDDAYCSKEYEEAGDDKELVESLIRKDLVIALGMYKSSDLKIRRQGLGIAVGALTWECLKLGNYENASMIADNCVMPYLDAATPGSCHYLCLEQIIINVVCVWKKTGQVDKAVYGYKLWLVNEPECNNKHGVRALFARYLNEIGEYEEALSYLRMISDDSSVAGAKKLIPEIEEKIKNAKTTDDFIQNPVR